MTDERTDAAPSLAEREILVKEREIALKEKEALRSGWFSPLVVAVTVAALGAFSNAGLAYFSATKEREMAADNAIRQRALQERAEEGALILASFQGGDTAKVPQRIELLLRSGLIRDGQVKTALVHYLAKEWIRTGRFAAVSLQVEFVDGCPKVLLLSPGLPMIKQGCKITLMSQETAESIVIPDDEETKPSDSIHEVPPVVAETPTRDAAEQVVGCIDARAVLISPYPADSNEIAGWCILVSGPLPSS